MRAELPFDDAPAQRLPLPLAQLYRRAHNAKTAIERHLTAFSLWEAGLKLLASVALVEYAGRGRPEPELQQVLQNLARPSLGHWWDFTRRLLPVLADAGDIHFQSLRDLLLGRSRDDLPHLAGLDAALREQLDGQKVARATVRCTELFDRLVRYRNIVLLGHSAPGQLAESLHERMGAALLAGLAELPRHLDALAGRRLVYVAEVRQAGGVWQAQRFDLSSGAVQRIASLELPREAAARVPDGERLYLEGPAADAPARPLHPLLLYDAEAEAVLFLNSRRGKKRTEYLCYTTGRTAERPDLAAEQRELLARALGMDVSEQQARGWAERLQEEAAAADGDDGEAAGVRRTLGEFELLSELGRGGMGVVYRAWQPSLRRQVALKKLLVPGDLRTEARFRREIRALGRVEHPHLVKIFTSGSDAEQWFYAMELVEGAPLSKVCQRLEASGLARATVDWPTWLGAVSTVCEEVRRAEKPLSEGGQPLPPAPTAAPAGDGDQQAAGVAVSPAGGNYVRQVVELVRQVAVAAHALHEEGIVHRDINPNNILVSADGSEAVLMDLGLAQLADDEEGQVTRTRQFVGTLRFSSPQQVLAVAKVDRRADVYSLGATLWELLALQPLFGAAEATPTPELMEKIQREEPQRLGHCRPGVARDLEAIVHRCLEKDAGRRYETAAELARDLGRWLAGEPVHARPVRGWERAWKWTRRNPSKAGVICMGLIAALATAVGVASWFYGTRLAAARDQAEVQRQMADLERREAECQRAIAEDQHRLARRYLYGAQMNLARQAWRESNLPLLSELLRQQETKDPRQDLRGFEWHYLHRCSKAGQRVVSPHECRITEVAYSPDGQLLASVGATGSVMLLDARTGSVLSVGEPERARGLFRTEEDACLAFTPDGKHLASLDTRRGQLLWWEITAQKRLVWARERIRLDPLTNPQPQRGGRLAFHPGGHGLAIAPWSDAGEVLVMSRPPGHLALESRHEPPTVASPVACVCFIPGEDLLAVPDDAQRAIRLIKVDTQETSRTLSGHGAAVSSLACSADGKYLACGTRASAITVWRISESRELHVLTGHIGDVRCLAFSPDGRLLASAGSDRTIKLWDLRAGTLFATLRGHESNVNSIVFNPDGRSVVSAGDDRKVRIWAFGETSEARTFKVGGPVQGLSISPDGQRIAAVAKSGVSVWALTDRQPSVASPPPGGTFLGVAFSPDGRWVAVGERAEQGQQRGQVRLLELRAAQWVRALPAKADIAFSVAIRPDGRVLAGSTSEGSIQLWDPRVGKPLCTCVGHEGMVYRVTFSADGRLMASAGQDRTIRLWNGETGALIRVLRGHTDGVTSVAFSRDGQLLASASQDQTIRVWNATSGALVHTCRGHTGWVLDVCMSPDGQRLASAADDRLVKLWDVHTGQEVFTFDGHQGAVRAVAFGLDGSHLLSAGDDGTVRVWSAR
jgi:WD40 repeat protein/serine/threonine protein kinase